MGSGGVKKVQVFTFFTGIKRWATGCEDRDRRIVRLYVEDGECDCADHADQHEFGLGLM
jgi:hypothetical protein